MKTCDQLNKDIVLTNKFTNRSNPANIRLDEDVLKTSFVFVLTSSRHLQDVLTRRLQDVFKTSSKNDFKTSTRRLAKMSSRRFEDVSSD